MKLEYLVKNKNYQTIDQVLDQEFDLSTRLKNKLIKEHQIYRNNEYCDTRNALKIGDKITVDLRFRRRQ